MPAARRQSKDPLERYYSRPEFVAPLHIWLRRVANRDVASLWRAVDAARRALDPLAPAVEPCVGMGHLVRGALLYGLRSRSAPWRTVDLDPGARAAMWIGDWRDPSTWVDANRVARGMRATLRSDLAMAPLAFTNPAFSIAVDVVEAAWRWCPRGVVAILQRDSWREPTRDRKEFLMRHPPDVITIGRCKFLGADGRPIRGKDGREGSGDTASYSWFVWGPDRVGLAGGMARIIPWPRKDT